MNKTNRKAPANAQEKISYLLGKTMDNYMLVMAFDNFYDELLFIYDDDESDDARDIFHSAFDILTSDWMVESVVARAIKNWENGDE